MYNIKDFVFDDEYSEMIIPLLISSVKDVKCPIFYNCKFSNYNIFSIFKTIHKIYFINCKFYNELNLSFLEELKYIDIKNCDFRESSFMNIKSPYINEISINKTYFKDYLKEFYKNINKDIKIIEIKDCGIKNVFFLKDFKKEYHIEMLNLRDNEINNFNEFYLYKKNLNINFLNLNNNPLKEYALFLKNRNKKEKLFISDSVKISVTNNDILMKKKEIERNFENLSIIF